MRKFLSFQKTIFALVVTAVLGISSLAAAVVVGTVNNMSQYQGSLDFNNDGTADFYFQSTTAYPDIDCINCVLRFTWNEVNNIWTEGNMEQGGWDNVHPLTAGTSIGTNGNWEAAEDAYLVDMSWATANIPVNQDVYVGFRMQINGGTHYGWAKVRLTGSESTGFTAQWLQCAYESTANTPIVAGNTGTGIVEIESNINVYPNPTANIVTVTNVNNSEITVYDFNGRQVNVPVRYENGDSVIDLTEQPAGTYFIRMEGRSAKVIKNA